MRAGAPEQSGLRPYCCTSSKAYNDMPHPSWAAVEDTSRLLTAPEDRSGAASCRMRAVPANCADADCGDRVLIADTRDPGRILMAGFNRTAALALAASLRAGAPHAADAPLTDAATH